METWVHVRQVWVPVFTCTRPLLCSRNRGRLLLSGLYENPFRFAKSCQSSFSLFFLGSSPIFSKRRSVAQGTSGVNVWDKRKESGICVPTVMLKNAVTGQVALEQVPSLDDGVT